MARTPNDFLGWPLLDNLSGIHDDHVLAQHLSHSQIVGHEEHGEAALPALSVEEPEDTELRCDVECRGRLIRDHQLGSPGERGRDRHALTHTTRELVGI